MNCVIFWIKRFFLQVCPGCEYFLLSDMDCECGVWSQQVDRNSGGRKLSDNQIDIMDLSENEGVPYLKVRMVRGL